MDMSTSHTTSADEPPAVFHGLLVTRTTGGVDVAVRTMTRSDLPEGEVTIRVEWSSVNYKDGMVTVPDNRVARISPLVPGVDLVGTVVSSTHTDVPLGAQVIAHCHGLGVSHHGGFADYARVPASWVIPLPEGLSARHAAVIGTAGFTAALSLRRLEHHGLTPDSGPVLVTGASGGVGSMAVSLLAARGYEVVASTGRPAETPYLEGLGAHRVVSRDEVLDVGPKTLGPERWAGAVDCVGGDMLAAILATLHYRGAVAASGLTGGNQLATTVYPFIVRSVSLIGIDAVETPHDERAAVWREVATSFAPDALDAMVAQEVDLEHLPPVLSAILDGQVRGRTLVRPRH